MPSAGGDARPQLERRDRFLAKGHFDFIAEAIAAQIESRLEFRAGDRLRILDAGCGTGYHLAGILKRLVSRAPAGFGIDLSKDAAGHCARRHPELTFAVADIWDRWPIHDASVDLVISVFAPKHYAEMARVLRPGGLLAMAFPGERHFLELRRAFDLLGQSGNKAETYAARIAAHFDPPIRRRFLRAAEFDQDDILGAILMGPNARHAAASRPDADRLRTEVTIDIEFLFARKPSSRRS